MGVAYCGNPNCTRIQCSDAECQNPDCKDQKEGKHTHCPKCEKSILLDEESN